MLSVVLRSSFVSISSSPAGISWHSIQDFGSWTQTDTAGRTRSARAQLAQPLTPVTSPLLDSQDAHVRPERSVQRDGAQTHRAVYKWDCREACIEVTRAAQHCVEVTVRAQKALED